MSDRFEVDLTLFPRLASGLDGAAQDARRSLQQVRRLQTQVAGLGGPTQAALGCICGAQAQFTQTITDLELLRDDVRGRGTQLALLQGPGFTLPFGGGPLDVPGFPGLPDWVPGPDINLPEWPMPGPDINLPEWLPPGPDINLPEWTPPGPDINLPEWPTPGPDINLRPPHDDPDWPGPHLPGTMRNDSNDGSGGDDKPEGGGGKHDPPRPRPPIVDDPTQIEGADPKDVEDKIPDHWIKQPTARGGGEKWVDPDRPGEQIRIMPGEPDAWSADHQGPYAIISRDGQKIRVPLKGNPTSDPVA